MSATASSKPKLALFTLTLARGGAEMAVYNLVTALHTDYEIHLVLMQRQIQFDLPADVQVHYLAEVQTGRLLKILMLPLLAWRYRNLLRRLKIQTSLSFLERPNFIACMARMLGSGARTCITISTSLAVFLPRTTLNGKIGRFLVKWLYPKAHAVVPCAKYVGYEMETEFGIPAARCHTIYNGINTAALRASAAEATPEPKTDFWFVCLASFYEGKNQQLLIDAFRRFSDTGRTATLWLLGRGYQLDAARAHATALGLDGKVHIPGFVKNPYAYIRASDCFAFPSNFEGLPTVLLEALACGKPIISTDCKAGPREIVAPGTDYTRQLQEGVEQAEHGLLVPTRDVDAMTQAMILAYDRPELLARYAETAEQRAADFELERTAAQYRALLFPAGRR